MHLIGSLLIDFLFIDEDRKNKCFICGIDRDTFEKNVVQFDNHVKYDHNLWNYVYFLIYLRNKNSLDYNGTESFLADRISKDDLSWFPLDRAMSLEGK